MIGRAVLLRRQPRMLTSSLGEHYLLNAYHSCADRIHLIGEKDALQDRDALYASICTA